MTRFAFMYGAILGLGLAISAALPALAEETAAPAEAAETSESEAAAQTASVTEALQSQIKDRADKVEQLEREIAQYQNELNRVGKERQTLERDVKTLDINRRKLTSNISLTQEKIKAAEGTISEIGVSIEDKERRINLNRDALAASLRTIDEMDQESGIETLLGGGEWTDVWEALDQTMMVQVALRQDVIKLKELHTELSASKTAAETTRKNLAQLKQNLSGQKISLDVTRSETASLLSATKNQETEYQKLLKEKQKAREEFDRELAELEAKLKFTLDKSSIPSPGRGILSWPFSGEFMNGCSSLSKALGNPYCITQYFGKTAFASTAYRTQSHNGVDFGVPVGTPVVAASTGTVRATGDTDTIRGCYSFGKWVLVDHGNGLSSLYGHLSRIGVSSGAAVARGERIGFSGNTGYSTGPHLHLSVYASAGVTVRTLGGTTACARAAFPIAATEAYLDPMSYL